MIQEYKFYYAHWSRIGPRLKSDFGDFDDLLVKAVGRLVKPAVRPPGAVLSSGLSLRTAVAVYTIRVVAFGAKPAWGHPRDGLQSDQLAFSQFARVVVVTVLLGALAEQEVQVAQFKLLDAAQLLARNVFEFKLVNALPVSVSWYAFHAVSTIA